MINTEKNMIEAEDAKVIKELEAGLARLEIKEFNK